MEAAAQEVAIIDLAAADHTVTAMHYAGPALLLAVAARTVLVDTTAAEAYLTRLRGSDAWLDQVSERLRAGASRGRLPVAPLAEQAIGWAEAVLSDTRNQPRAFPAAAAGLGPRDGLGGRAPVGRHGRGVPGAGQVGDHRQGTAPAGTAVRPCRA